MVVTWVLRSGTLSNFEGVEGGRLFAEVEMSGASVTVANVRMAFRGWRSISAGGSIDDLLALLRTRPLLGVPLPASPARRLKCARHALETMVTVNAGQLLVTRGCKSDMEEEQAMA